jgi:hypothetical protein
VAAIPIGVRVHENAAALLCVGMLWNDGLAVVASTACEQLDQLRKIDKALLGRIERLP